MFPIFAGNSAATGYNLTRSLRFRASANASLNRTPASASNRKTWTLSFWLKVGITGDPTIFGAGNVGVRPSMELSIYHTSDSSRLNFLSYNGSSYDFNFTTTASFRDPSAWYHFVIVFDTTQVTSTNRVKIYVNGSQLTAFNTAAYPSLNFDGAINNTVRQVFSAHTFNASGSNLDGYLAETYFIDGQALTPSSFGSTNALTGVWQPARYTGTSVMLSYVTPAVMLMLLVVQ